MSMFFGMSPRTHAEYIDRLREGFLRRPGPLPRHGPRPLLHHGRYAHTVLPFNGVRHAHINDMPLRDWLRQMVDHDPEWRSWCDCDGVVMSSRPQGV